MTDWRGPWNGSHVQRAARNAQRSAPARRPSRVARLPLHVARCTLRFALGIPFALTTACGDGTPNPVLQTMSARAEEEAEAAVAFRFAAAEGADVQIFRLPGLESAEWDLEGPRAATARTIGLASDEDLLYLLTDAGELATLDLAVGRSRVVDTAVAVATMSPTGVPYFIRTDGSIALVNRRSVANWDTKVETPPGAIWTGARGRIVGVYDDPDDRRLVLLTDGRPPEFQSLPAGPVAVSRWADLVAVATDSGLVTIDPADSTDRQFRRFRSEPLAVAFSPSAHRIYLLTTDGRLTALERFELDVIDRLRLPGPADAARGDPVGRMLLVKPADQDSVWVVDLVGWQPGAPAASAWDDELPAVAPDGTVLLWSNDTLATYDPVEGRTLARIQARDDHWFIAAWDPRRPALQFAQDTAAAAEGATGPTGGAFYVQVSSTRNPAWAEDFARNLQRAGVAASVLPPTADDELYRVVLGPYPTRDAAEDIGRQLGLPYWITTRDTLQAPA